MTDDMNEWTELKTMADVCEAQAKGWEIEERMHFYDDAYKSASKWVAWDGSQWLSRLSYRGRPRRL